MRATLALNGLTKGSSDSSKKDDSCINIKYRSGFWKICADVFEDFFFEEFFRSNV